MQSKENWNGDVVGGVGGRVRDIDFKTFKLSELLFTSSKIPPKKDFC